MVMPKFHNNWSFQLGVKLLSLQVKLTFSGSSMVFFSANFAASTNILLQSSHLERIITALNSRQKQLHLPRKHDAQYESVLPADENDYREIWEFFFYNQNQEVVTIDELYESRTVLVRDGDEESEFVEEPLRIYVTGFVAQPENSKGPQLLHNVKIELWAFDYDNGGIWIQTENDYWYRLKRPASFYKLSSWDFFLQVSIWLKVHHVIENLHDHENMNAKSLSLSVLKERLCDSPSFVTDAPHNTLYIGLLAQNVSFVLKWMKREDMTHFKCYKELLRASKQKNSHDAILNEDERDYEEPDVTLNPLLCEEEEELGSMTLEELERMQDAEANQDAPSSSNTDSASPILSQFYLHLVLNKQFPQDLCSSSLPFPFSFVPQVTDLVNWFWHLNDDISGEGVLAADMIQKTPTRAARRRKSKEKAENQSNDGDDAFVPPAEQVSSSDEEELGVRESPVFKRRIQRKRKRDMLDNEEASDRKQKKRRKDDDPHHRKYRLSGSLIYSVEEYKEKYNIYTGKPKKPQHIVPFHKIKDAKDTTLIEYMPEDQQKSFKATKKTAEDDFVLEDFKDWRREYGTAAPRERKKGQVFHDKIYYGHFEEHFLKTFDSRKKMKAMNLHNIHMAGIDCSKKGCAAGAIVSSSGGGYDVSDDYNDCGDVLFYVGGGGGTRYNDEMKNGVGIENQRLDKGPSHSLFLSFIHRIPVRVFRGPKMVSFYRPSKDYRYDGLYAITAVAQDIIEYEASLNSKEKTSAMLPGIIFRFRLVRLDTSTPLPKQKSLPSRPIRQSRSSFLIGLYSIAQRSHHYRTRLRPQRTRQLSRISMDKVYCKNTREIWRTREDSEVLPVEEATARWERLPFSLSKETRITYIPGEKGFETHRACEVKLLPKGHFLYHPDNSLFEKDPESGKDVILSTPNQSFGVFASEDIPARTLLGMYTGERHPENTEIQGSYIFEITQTRELIDAQDCGNETRFFNSCGGLNPIEENNVAVYEDNLRLMDPVNHTESRFIIYFLTKCDVKAGEELLLNYGNEYLQETVEGANEDTESVNGESKEDESAEEKDTAQD